MTAKTPAPKRSDFELMAGACALAHLADTGNLPTPATQTHLPFRLSWVFVLGRLTRDNINLEALVDTARKNFKKYTDKEPNPENSALVLTVNIALMRNPGLHGDELKKEADSILQETTGIAVLYSPDTTRYESVKELVDRRSKIALGLLLEQIGGSTTDSLRFNRAIGTAPFMLVQDETVIEAQTLTRLAERLVERDLRAGDPEFSEKTSKLVGAFMAAAEKNLPERQREDLQIVAREAYRLMVLRLSENDRPHSKP